MDELISRQAAIEAVNCVMVMKGIRSGKSITAEAVDCAKRIIADNIRQLPPAEPKRGKWIKTARWGRVYYCNQCRNYLDFDGVNAGRGSTNYCPNCGCRMDGGEQE